jgi:hypothetical protein
MHSHIPLANVPTPDLPGSPDGIVTPGYINSRRTTCSPLCPRQPVMAAT